jgi:hypothetical protein
MASGDTGNVVPGNRLRVRLPCPPLHARDAILAIAGLPGGPAVVAGGGGVRDAIPAIADVHDEAAAPLAA